MDVESMAWHLLSEGVEYNEIASVALMYDISFTNALVKILEEKELEYSA